VAPDPDATRRTIGVVLAGGLGTRIGADVPKQLLEIAGQPLLTHTLTAFEHSPDIDSVLLVMTPEFRGQAEALVVAGGFTKVSAVVEGGPTRDDSTRRALDALGTDDCNVLIQDAARPFVTSAMIHDCVMALAQAEGVVVAIPTSDTVLEVDDGTVTGVPDRRRLRRAQTPQGFRLSTLRRAYALAGDDATASATDNCGVVRRFLPEVVIRVVEGSEENIKVTSGTDLAVADLLARRRLVAAGDHDPELGAVEGLYRALIAGWNARDAAAMSAPFAEDGVIIGYDGSLTSGRAALAADMAQIFADHQTARYVVKVRETMPLGPDARILRAIAGLVPPGQAQVKPDVNAHQTLVAARRDGHWRVVLFQNTPAQFHGRPELVEELTRELQAVADQDS
jgi:2-C-methyl-D-erythritol 4-phosphate cytidylyltransferase